MALLTGIYSLTAYYQPDYVLTFPRDCTEYNLMMDAAGMYPEPWHPVDPEMKADYSGPVTHLPRTGHPVRYYLIDFGLSKQWEPGTKPPLLPPVEAGDKTLPEYRGKGSETPHEPLSADVYYIGNFFREEFLQVKWFFLRWCLDVC